MKKRLLSILLVLCLLLSILPTTTFATSSGDLIHEPEVTEFTVTYMDGEESKTVSLLDNPQQIVMNEGCKPVFTVKFDTSTLLDKVYVTSTKDEDIKYLEALPTDTNTYVTKDYFDPEDLTYVPGTLEISYTKKTVTVSNDDTIDGIDPAEIKQQLVDSGIYIGGDVTTVDNSVSAQIVLRDYSNEMGDVLVDASVEELTSSAGIDSDEVQAWLGGYNDITSFSLKGESGQDIILYFADKDWADANSYAMVIRDVSGSKYSKMILHGAELNELAEKLSQTNQVTELYLDYVGISAEMDTLREQVDAHPFMTSEQKTQAYQQITELEKDKKLFTLGLSIVPLFMGIAGVGNPPLMIAALLAGYSSVADYFWQNRVGMIQGCEPVEGIFSENTDHPGWIGLTRTSVNGSTTIEESGRYYLTQNLSGITISGNKKVILCLHGYSVNGTINMEAGVTLTVQDCEYSEHTDGTIAGGMIRYITMGAQSNLTLEKGIIRGTYGHAIVCDGSAAKITINGGVVEGIAGACIFDDGGNAEITINAGILKAGMEVIRANRSNITFNSGTVLAEDSGYAVYESNGSSTVQINGGELNGGFNTGGCITVDIKQGSIVGNIRSGTVFLKRGDCTGNVSGSNVTITGGEIDGQVSGTNVIIEDGVILGGATFSTDTTAVINGGILYGDPSDGISINNYRTSSLTINGGTIYGSILNSNVAQLTITNGTIYGRVENYSTEPVLLRIKNGSDIQVSGNPAFTKSPLVVADTGYSGNIICYNSDSAPGIPMTIEQANEIDYTKPYIRIVADGSVQPPVECEHSYSSVLTPPTCTQRGYTIHTCSKCGDSYTDSYTAALGHDFGPWVITQAASSNTTGLRERTCSRCGDKETQVIPATGGTNSGSSGSSSSQPSYYINTESSTIGGKVTLSSTNAPRGATVTLTVIPDDGYELASLSVADKSGNDLKLTDQGSGKYSFIMPASKVYVEATFAKAEQPVNNLFIDVPDGAYYYDAVQWAAEKGITSGTSETTFSPYVSCTRAQAVTFLWRAAGSPAPKSSVMPFSDVASDAYYNDAVLWATENSITSGTSATTFTPDANCTRAQIVTFLWRAEEAFATDLENPFVDVASDAYYSDAVLWAVENGITSGTSATTFAPDANCTRAQIVTFLYREEMN